MAARRAGPGLLRGARAAGLRAGGRASFRRRVRYVGGLYERRGAVRPAAGRAQLPLGQAAVSERPHTRAVDAPSRGRSTLEAGRLGPYALGECLEDAAIPE